MGLFDALRRLWRGELSRPTHGRSGRGPVLPVRSAVRVDRADVPGIRAEYSPRRDGEADPGEVVWAWVPFEEDVTRGKDRPLLVIGRLGRGVVALQLTTQPRQDRRHHPLGPGPWDRDGRSSWLRLDQLVRLDPAGIRREGAILDRRRFDGVVAAWEAYED